MLILIIIVLFELSFGEFLLDGWSYRPRHRCRVRWSRQHGYVCTIYPLALSWNRQTLILIVLHAFVVVIQLLLYCSIVQLVIDFMLSW